ncbi:MAG: formate-nitrite transporter family protein [Actinomycetota bacterium]|jgi:protein-disulfide isomerase|nr:formate-nitrite transporter family protein [Actinomycetota bacterium]
MTQTPLELVRTDVSLTETDHVRGDVAAPITLLVYGEFECPDCGRAFHTIQEILDEMPGEVRFAFRHFARDDVHPFSVRSAEAAEAAGAQGHFWEMHDFLFTHQHSLEYSDLLVHAAKLGLDVERFQRELTGRVHRDKVEADLASGVSNGVTSTPTFFINGTRYQGSNNRDELKDALRA